MKEDLLAQEPIIALENVAIGYDGQAVLSDISLSVARGSFGRARFAPRPPFPSGP